jgi:hypothetical protein
LQCAAHVDKHTKRSIGGATCCEIITKICQAARVGIHLGDRQGTHTSISPVGKIAMSQPAKLPTEDTAASFCMAPSWHLRSPMVHFSCWS